MNKKQNDRLNITNSLICNEFQQRSIDMDHIMTNKILKLQEIIQNTILSIQLYKRYNIYSNGDVILCLSSLNDIYLKTGILYDLIKDKNVEGFIEKIQHIVDKISIIISSFGSKNIEDLLFIIFGSEFINHMNSRNKDKYNLLKQFVHPIHYKIVNWKQSNKQKSSDRHNDPTIILCSNKICDDPSIIEMANHLECFDIDQTVKQYYIKVSGIRVVIHNEIAQKTVIIDCICEDISLDCITNPYINNRLTNIYNYTLRCIIPAETSVDNSLLNYITASTTGLKIDQSIIIRMIETLTIKDILIYGDNDFYKKLMIIDADISMVINNKIDILIKKFIEMDMYDQRNLLINMLIYNKNDEVQYITYLLYDLITLNTPNSPQTDSTEQIALYDSFPIQVKLYFKEAMKYTITYSQNMMKKYDTNMITMEQKIYLLKVPENVKEKAMMKFKELKGKSDDSGSKSKQYLEGLLKIPFGSYKHEPLLKTIQTINDSFKKVIHKSHVLIDARLDKKLKYTNIEILKYTNSILNKIANEPIIETYIRTNDAYLKNIIDTCTYINSQSVGQSVGRITGKTKADKIQNILKYMTSNTPSITEKCKIYDILYSHNQFTFGDIIQDYTIINNSVKNVETTMNQVIDVLDDSIYGHTYAKNQILKVVGQWLNGEQSGYCFGFEGSPGIGKTSLAKKGLSQCLKDENEQSRPFAFIALGGSCNGSTLEGHSYTYVNSIWGRIVDILMETKCMNPIIYIDELDKVSKTEHGKEIIGILTHMIDSTQNDVFQDKYFSGIDIDLSKVLFIFSYNDPEQIDRVLLDRIHRIKFDNLSITDKMVVVKKYIIPEIHKKMGLSQDAIYLDDLVIEHIIEYYTMEPGIRKLKEILFDIYGEINIELLKCTNYETVQMPIVISTEMLKTKYLKKYIQILEKVIGSSPQIGIINGLWANSLGKGGIIPIETVFFPSTTFLDLRLTGMQGDVMKESMNVALSLAWSLTPDIRKTDLIQFFDKTLTKGVHIHCPDGAVSKDGPSAGAAITTAIYSLFNNTPINNEFAMTGEIDLMGNITAIGGLESKILGGIRAGVKTFLFPESNMDDFQDFKTKYMVADKYAEIQFIPVKHISNVFAHLRI